MTLENGATLADAALVDVGFGSIGSLTAQTGAQLVSVGADIGRLAGTTAGNGTVLLDASTWTSSGAVDVGAGANGSALLQIEDGATLQASATLAAGTPFLFVDETVAGQAVVDVGGAVVNAGSNSVDIGEAGFGTLTLHGGAVLDAGSTGGQPGFVLGDQDGASGTATLTGVGTTVHVNGAASIGASGAGDLSVGGTFATTGAMVLGLGSTGSGAVSVAGVGSDLAVRGQLDLGGGTQAGGTGALTVGSGGTLSAASAVLFGGGALLVDAGGVAEIGTGSTQVAGNLIVNAGVTAGTGVDVSGVGSTVILGPDGMVLGDGAMRFLDGAERRDVGRWWHCRYRPRRHRQAFRCDRGSACLGRRGAWRVGQLDARQRNHRGERGDLDEQRTDRGRRGGGRQRAAADRERCDPAGERDAGCGDAVPVRRRECCRPGDG